MRLRGRLLMVVVMLAVTLGFSPRVEAQTGFFQSQLFGFSMQWGAEWTVFQQGSTGTGVEGVQLGNGVSSVVAMGVTTAGTPQDTVLRALDTLASPVQLVSVVFDEPGRAAAYFISTDQQIGVFIDAIVLDAQSQLVVLWAFPPAQYDAEFNRFLNLMAGLQF